MTFFLCAGLVALVAIVALRPHGWGPAAGAALGVAIGAIGGGIQAQDLTRALSLQWQAFVILAGVMTMTSTAERLGLLERLAARIEPRTRGPVKHAFRVTFVIGALVAAVLSNDAAVLLLTPAILALLRTVYPRRNPKFLVPFAFAVFAAAGVAPLVISNPMNLVLANHLGIPFNRYSATMIPVALASWVATYAALALCFRDVLVDEAPALGAWTGARGPLSPSARVVLVVLVLVLGGYPVASYLGAPLWPVALAGGVTAAAASLAAGARVADLARGITWSIFPFLVAVFVLAIGLDRIGAVDQLVALYRGRGVATVGVVSAIGSAVLNNHPMSVLNGFALERMGPNDALAFAALVGGDLGPRLLPVGSLASLLWFDILRRQRVEVPLTTFIRVGAIITLPALVVSLAVLWLLS